MAWKFNPFTKKEDYFESGIQSVRTATKIVAANDSLDKTRADYVCDGINDQVEIQAAINALATTGGTVKLLEGTYTIGATINLASNVILEGCGKGTKITTAGAITITMITATSKDYVWVRNIFLYQPTYAVTGISFNTCNYSKITGMFINTYDTGINWNTGQYNEIRNNIIWQQTAYSSTWAVTVNAFNQSIIANNLIYQNSSGLSLLNSTSVVIYGNIFNTSIYKNIQVGNGTGQILCIGNLLLGISTTDANNGALYLTGNESGIYAENFILGVPSPLPAIRIYGDITDNAKGILISNNSINVSGYGIDINGTDPAYIQDIIIQNNYIKATAGAFNNISGTRITIAQNNIGIDASQVKEYVRMKNTSGASLVAGNVVVLKSVAGGNEVTTTTIAGDNKVFGMAVESIADNSFGYIQILGKTTLLKVNGTTAIAIGDFLSTYTEAGIAKKAASGEMAFAIALEAYSGADSNGVIDALLITPRKV
jgi:hypothetical protein